MTAQRPFAQRHVGKIAGGGMAAAIALAAPLVMLWEGKRNVGYLDIGNVPTHCYGETQGSVVDRRYTDEECNTALARSLRKHADGIAACIHVETPAESFAAFTVFAYNVGVGAFCKSTVARRLNSGDLAGACTGLDAWVYVKGKRIKGLVNRRKAERELCERGLAA